MKLFFKSFVVAFLLFLIPIQAQTKELNTIMMQATCKIIAKGSLGTGFIIGKPDPNNAPKAFYTLITAAHVLESIQDNKAILVLRKQDDLGTWKRLEVPILVRNENGYLWKKHAEVDVAAMLVRLPKGAVQTLLSTDFLITDEQLNEYEIYPGYEILCLGYPFGAEANEYGFPILRSGKIASYPLTPTRVTKTFLFDFTVFRGNSSGPVYFVEKNPSFGGSVHLGRTIQGILGIVVREKSITQRIEQLYEKKEITTPLSIAEVIHASFIRELVDELELPRKAVNQSANSN